MAREQIMAAGGIVLRREQPPRVAVVRLRKRDEWVLPKGKLDDGETPRDAAKREVVEETGHNVTVHEFLGTLVVDTGTRAKIVHYWRMEASGEATRPLMDDIRAVDWLPLDEAVERLSRSHEKTFLENVGPYALAGLIRRTKAKPEEEEKAAEAKTAAKPAAKSTAAGRAATAKVAAAKPATARKRRTPAIEPAELVPPEPMPLPAEMAPAEATAMESASIVTETIPEARPIEAASAPDHVVTAEASKYAPAAPWDEPVAPEAEPAAVESEPPKAETIEAGAPADGAPGETTDVERVQAVAAKIKSMTTEVASRIAQARDDDEEQDEPLQHVAVAPGAAAEPDASALVPSEVQHAAEPQGSISEAAHQTEPQRRTLAQKVRGWFGRAA
ncbi:NUDIX domain-containing protein [Bradyrhizobium sp. STM 3557]|uniref:NUDIX hydrolase n=1 Tax=Bradyrhizobium sp. STM 3557 TaxID=578920 RepID=UPI00388E035A